MKKCIIFWKGQSKSGNFYVGVNYDVDGFMCKKFIQVTEAKFETLPESGEINVPESALS